MSRLCACGCGDPLDGRSARALYVSRTHAQRAYRRRLIEDLRAAGLPTSVSRAQLGSSVPVTGGNGGAQTPRRSRSGAQVSYRKAVEVVAQALSKYSYLGGPMDGFIMDAENVLREALPEKQRARIRA